MNSNYEINRHLANERVTSRLRDAETHRQARMAREQRSGQLLRKLGIVSQALLQWLGSHMRLRPRVPRPALLRRRQSS